MTTTRHIQEFKILIVGDSSVGKTSLITQFSEQEFYEENEATITGMKLLVNTVLLQDQKTKLLLWDTAGSEESFRTMSKSVSKDVAGALLLFDITRRETFLNLSSWLNLITEKCDQNICVILLGNKCDEKEFRQVSSIEALKFAQEQGLIYFETSAKTAQNVQQAFNHLSQTIQQKQNVSQSLQKGIKSNDSILQGTLQLDSASKFDSMLDQEGSSMSRNPIFQQVGQVGVAKGPESGFKFNSQLSLNKQIKGTAIQVVTVRNMGQAISSRNNYQQSHSTGHLLTGIKKSKLLFPSFPHAEQQQSKNKLLGQQHMVALRAYPVRSQAARYTPMPQSNKQKDNPNLMQALVKSLSRQTKDQVMSYSAQTIETQVFKSTPKSPNLPNPSFQDKVLQQQPVEDGLTAINFHQQYIDQVLRSQRDAVKASQETIRMLSRNLTQIEPQKPSSTSIFAKRLSRDKSPLAFLPKDHHSRRSQVSSVLGMNMTPNSKKYELPKNQTQGSKSSKSFKKNYKDVKKTYTIQGEKLVTEEDQIYLLGVKNYQKLPQLTSSDEILVTEPTERRFKQSQSFVSIPQLSAKQLIPDQQFTPSMLNKQRVSGLSNGHKSKLSQPRITQQGSNATSKIQHMLNTGKHNVFVPQKPNKNIRSAYILKTEVSSNILPLARVSGMLIRQEEVASANDKSKSREKTDRQHLLTKSDLQSRKLVHSISSQQMNSSKHIINSGGETAKEKKHQLEMAIPRTPIHIYTNTQQKLLVSPALSTIQRQNEHQQEVHNIPMPNENFNIDSITTTPIKQLAKISSPSQYPETSSQHFRKRQSSKKIRSMVELEDNNNGAKVVTATSYLVKLPSMTESRDIRHLVTSNPISNVVAQSTIVHHPSTIQEESQDFGDTFNPNKITTKNTTISPRTLEVNDNDYNDVDQEPKSSLEQTKDSMPEILREQPDTPRTRQVKMMVLNANRGHQNPLKIDQGLDVKYRQNPHQEPQIHSKTQEQEYLYKQVNQDGFNTRLVSEKDIKKQKKKLEREQQHIISSDNPNSYLMVNSNYSNGGVLEFQTQYERRYRNERDFQKYLDNQSKKKRTKKQAKLDNFGKHHYDILPQTADLSINNTTPKSPAVAPLNIVGIVGMREQNNQDLIIPPQQYTIMGEIAQGNEDFNQIVGDSALKILQAEETNDNHSSDQEQSVEEMEEDYFTALRSIENGMNSDDKTGDEASENIGSVFQKSFQSQQSKSQKSQRPKQDKNKDDGLQQTFQEQLQNVPNHAQESPDLAYRGGALVQEDFPEVPFSTIVQDENERSTLGLQTIQESEITTIQHDESSRRINQNVVVQRPEEKPIKQKAASIKPSYIQQLKAKISKQQEVLSKAETALGLIPSKAQFSNLEMKQFDFESAMPNQNFSSVTSSCQQQQTVKMTESNSSGQQVRKAKAMPKVSGLQGGYFQSGGSHSSSRRKQTESPLSIMAPSTIAMQQQKLDFSPKPHAAPAPQLREDFKPQTYASSGERKSQGLQNFKSQPKSTITSEDAQEEDLLFKKQNPNGQSPGSLSNNQLEMVGRQSSAMWDPKYQNNKNMLIGSTIQQQNLLKKRSGVKQYIRKITHVKSSIKPQTNLPVTMFNSQDNTKSSHNKKVSGTQNQSKQLVPSVPMKHSQNSSKRPKIKISQFVADNTKQALTPK